MSAERPHRRAASFAAYAPSVAPHVRPEAQVRPPAALPARTNDVPPSRQTQSRSTHPADEHVSQRRENTSFGRSASPASYSDDTAFRTSAPVDAFMADMVLRDSGVKNPQNKEIFYRACDGGIESVHVHLLAQTLKMQERFDAFEKGVTHLEKKTNEIVELVATRWEPSRDEKRAYQDVAMHYLTTHFTSVSDLFVRVERYIVKNRATYGLTEVQVENQITRAKLRHAVKYVCNEARRILHETVVESILPDAHSTVEAAAQGFYTANHVGDRTAKVDDHYVALWALMRAVERRRNILKKTQPSVWREVDHDLAEAVERNGDPHDGENKGNWYNWDMDRIQEDRVHYPARRTFFEDAWSMPQESPVSPAQATLPTDEPDAPNRRAHDMTHEDPTDPSPLLAQTVHHATRASRARHPNATSSRSSSRARSNPPSSSAASTRPPSLTSRTLPPSRGSSHTPSRAPPSLVPSRTSTPAWSAGGPTQLPSHTGLGSFGSQLAVAPGTSAVSAMSGDLHYSQDTSRMSTASWTYSQPPTHGPASRMERFGSASELEWRLPSPSSGHLPGPSQLLRAGSEEHEDEGWSQQYELSQGEAQGSGGYDTMLVTD